MRLEVLRAASPAAAIDLGDARGLVAFVAEGDAAWRGYLAGLRAAFAAGGRVRGPGTVVRGGAAAATVGTAAFEALLGTVLERHALRREEFAAVWLGEGPPRVWVAAAVALLRGPDATRRLREGAARGKPGLEGSPSGAEVVAGWVGGRVREARDEVERLSRSPERVADVEARLGALREEAAVVQGDADAAAMVWLRERQDAETRLLLHRDRERELRGRLEDIRKAGSAPACATCERPLGGRADVVRRARREEWEAVVQDGKWWRRRRAQLDLKPDELKALETRALSLSAEIADLAEELERRRAEALQLDAAAKRLEELKALERRLATGPEATAVGAVAGEAEAEAEAEREDALSVESARRRFRATVHARFVAFTGGRFAAGFPELYSEWVAGGGGGGEADAALRLAARVVLAEMAVRAGVRLGSVVLPSGLERVSAADLPRALPELVRLSRRVPQVLVKATARVVAGAPESFDLLYGIRTGTKGGRVRRQSLGLATFRLEE